MRAGRRMTVANESKCKSCGAPLLWARTRWGNTIPLDALPHPAGNVRLHRDGTAEVLGPSGRLDAKGPLYRSHYVSCPDAEKHRRRRRKAPAGTLFEEEPADDAGRDRRPAPPGKEA